MQEGKRNRAANLAKLATMTPDMPLTDWYPLLDVEGGVPSEALEALRHIERRQSDIEFLLSKGVPRAMMLLPGTRAEGYAGTMRSCPDLFGEPGKVLASAAQAGPSGVPNGRRRGRLAGRHSLAPEPRV